MVWGVVLLIHSTTRSTYPWLLWALTSQPTIKSLQNSISLLARVRQDILSSYERFQLRNGLRYRSSVCGMGVFRIALWGGGEGELDFFFINVTFSGVKTRVYDFIHNSVWLTWAIHEREGVHLVCYRNSFFSGKNGGRKILLGDSLTRHCLWREQHLIMLFAGQKFRIGTPCHPGVIHETPSE